MAKIPEKYLTGWVNVKGTSDRNCPCGTWRNHWYNFSDASAQFFCAVQGCYGTFDVGGHMRHQSSQSEFIVPLCHSCNMSDRVFTLKSGTYVAFANMSKTCKK